jgi:hypothetical protein
MAGYILPVIEVIFESEFRILPVGYVSLYFHVLTTTF